MNPDEDNRWLRFVRSLTQIRIAASEEFCRVILQNGFIGNLDETPSEVSVENGLRLFPYVREECEESCRILLPSLLLVPESGELLGMRGDVVLTSYSS